MLWFVLAFLQDLEILDLLACNTWCLAVETKNIDGETNLKVRNAKADIHAACKGSIEGVSALNGTSALVD